MFLACSYNFQHSYKTKKFNEWWNFTSHLSLSTNKVCVVLIPTGPYEANTIRTQRPRQPNLAHAFCALHPSMILYTKINIQANAERFVFVRTPRIFSLRTNYEPFLASFSFWLTIGCTKLILSPPNFSKSKWIDRVKRWRQGGWLKFSNTPAEAKGLINVYICFLSFYNRFSNLKWH